METVGRAQDNGCWKDLELAFDGVAVGKIGGLEVKSGSICGNVVVLKK